LWQKDALDSTRILQLGLTETRGTTLPQRSRWVAASE
jgi:hypothetical protein